MNFYTLTPHQQLVAIMQRLYERGLTTTSGGNLSIRDADGNIWITPAGVDKGNLTPEDIVFITNEGHREGRHEPSSELPFHRYIYEARPDIRAIVHAHPIALVAFSLVGKMPEIRLTPQTFAICGEVGYAPYALPGSETLGANIADAFTPNANIVILENHGVVAGGSDILQAFHRLETLEFSANMQINATSLGGFTTFSDEEIASFSHSNVVLPLSPQTQESSTELEERLAITDIVRRAYKHGLMTSTGGTISIRLGEDDFLITPHGLDRKYLETNDIVRVFNGQRQADIVPSRATHLHRAIYARHPEVNCIVSAQPSGIMSFGISKHVSFDTKLIPETYIVLRQMPSVPFNVVLDSPETVAEQLSTRTPAILIRHDTLLTIGKTILQAFDRIEVAEFSAQALLKSRSLGTLRPITHEAVHELERKYFPDEQ